MYVVKTGDSISTLLYVGTTGGDGLDARFRIHDYVCFNFLPIFHLFVRGVFLLIKKIYKEQNF